MNLELIKSNALAVAEQCDKIRTLYQDLAVIRSRPDTYVYERNQTKAGDTAQKYREILFAETILAGMMK